MPAASTEGWELAAAGADGRLLWPPATTSTGVGIGRWILISLT
jgi:hypothetical protein